MKDYITRMINEKLDLEIKVVKAESFINSELGEKTPAEERLLLTRQIVRYKEVIEILGERIALAKKREGEKDE